MTDHDHYYRGYRMPRTTPEPVSLDTLRRVRDALPGSAPGGNDDRLPRTAAEVEQGRRCLIDTVTPLVRTIDVTALADAWSEAMTSQLDLEGGGPQCRDSSYSPRVS